MSAWVRVGALASLPEGKATRIELAGEALCLVRAGDAAYAVEDRCPHRGARLSGGVVYDRCKVACPDHGWSIDLGSGCVEPPDTGQARTFAVDVRGEDVFIRLREQA